MVLVVTAITNVRWMCKDSTFILNLIWTQIFASVLSQTAIVSPTGFFTEGTDITVVKAVPAVSAVIERTGWHACLFEDQMVTEFL